MFNLSELARGGTICLSHAGLNSSDEKIDVAAPNGAGIDYCINGVFYHEADADDNANVTADTAQAALTTCIYLVTLSTTHVLATVKGTEVTTADIASGKSVLNWPQPAVNTCPIGAAKVVVATGYTFTPGTTEFDATGITTTWVNFMCIPDKPVTSEYDPFVAAA